MMPFGDKIPAIWQNTGVFTQPFRSKGDGQVASAAEITGKLQQLAEQIPELAGGAFAPAFESGPDMREQISRLKQQLHQLAQSVEEQKLKYAESYRQRLGEGKAAFEAMGAGMQSRTHPEAFNDKQTFARLQQTIDLISHIQGDLLDLDGRIEQEELRSRPSPSPNAAQAPSYDQDPAPPTMSP